MGRVLQFLDWYFWLWTVLYEILWFVRARKRLAQGKLVLSDEWVSHWGKAWVEQNKVILERMD